MMAHTRLFCVLLIALSSIASANGNDRKDTINPAKGLDAHGDPLPAGAVARLGTVRFRHGNFIYDVSYSPDGKTLASISSEGLRVWETATGKQRYAETGRDGLTSFSSVAFSPDGKILAASSWDGFIHLFDAATGLPVRSWRGHADVCWGVQFSADGKILVSGSRDGVVRLWDWKSARQIEAFGKTTKMAAVNGLLSADGKTLISAGWRNYGIRIWDATTGKEERKIEFTRSSCPAIRFAPDGKTLMAVAGGLKFFDLQTGKEVYADKFPADGISCAEFSPDGKILAVGGYAAGKFSKVHCFDWATGQLISRLGVSGGGISALAFAPQGKILAVCDHNDANVRFFEWKSGKERTPPAGHTGGIRALAFAPDEKTLFSAGDASVRSWDLSAAKERHQFLDHDHLVYSLALSSDGKTLAAGSGAGLWSRPDGEILLWDVPSKKRRLKITPQKLGNIFTLRFSPNGQALLSSFSAGGWRVWETSTGNQLLRMPPDVKIPIGKGRMPELLEPCSSALWADDGHLIVSAHQRSLHLWDAALGHSRRKIEVPIHVSYNYAAPLAVSANGQWLALGDQNGDIHLFEVMTGQRAFQFKAYEGWIMRLAFSPDGRTLVSAERDSVADVWDLPTKTKRTSLADHRGLIQSMTFSWSGNLLATGSRDSTVLVWDTKRFPKPKHPAAKFTNKQLEDLWKKLGGLNASETYEAIWTLADNPSQSLAFIQKKLRKVSFPPPDKVRSWIADLDDEKFRVREQATHNLEAAGHKVERALRQALAENKPLEFHLRVKQLLQKLENQPMPPIWLQCRRAVQVLEAAGTAEARKMLSDLAERGMPEAATALQRLARRPVAEERDDHE